MLWYDTIYDIKYDVIKLPKILHLNMISYVTSPMISCVVLFTRFLGHDVICEMSLEHMKLTHILYDIMTQEMGKSIIDITHDTMAFFK